jgi:hypothetical protein
MEKRIMKGMQAMKNLFLEETQDTPRVTLNKGDQVFEISGRSLPEDAVEFYTPVIDWIHEYSQEPNAATDFAFKLEYFNTASSKLILDMMMALKSVKGVKILWYFYEDDESIDDAGKEYAEQVNIPFEFKTID